MAIRDALLPEFDQEMKNTRITLERVPEDKLGWKPHDKSWAMGGLATHVANLVSWTNRAIEADSLDLAPNGVKMPPMQAVTSRQELLAIFDKNAVAARAAIAGAADADLLKPWTLLQNGKTLMTLPKIAVLRSFMMNHMIHHRAQLGVYLRLNDVAVPAIYGPSADEAIF